MASYTKKGKCTNFTSGDQKGCPKADANEIIEVDITDDFVCPHCHGDLMEVADKPKGVPSWIWAIVAAVVLGGGGAGAWFALGGGEKEVPVQEITLDAETYTVMVGEKVMINAMAMPIEATNPALSYASADEAIATVTGPEITGVKAGKTTITVTTLDGSLVEKSVEVTVKAKVTAPQAPKYPTVGTFTGKLKDGYPHGTGTLTFQAQRLIDAHDSKNRLAQPGDYLIGEWDNGHLIQARWYDSANNLKETIVLGKCMNPEKDHPLGRFRKQ